MRGGYAQVARNFSNFNINLDDANLFLSLSSPLLPLLPPMMRDEWWIFPTKARKARKQPRVPLTELVTTRVEPNFFRSAGR